MDPMTLSLLLSMGSMGMNKLSQGKAPELKSPVNINGSDIDRIIGLMRSKGTKSIMSNLGNAQQRGVDFLAGQGTAGTGGAPAQMWSSLEANAGEQIAGLEGDLAGTEANMMMQIQQMLNQNANTQFNADWSNYQNTQNVNQSALDTLGMGAFLKYMKP
jgi:hypothetical protein